MVQYHALGLIYHIRKNDRLAVTKLVGKYTRGGLKSPYATCMLVSWTSLYIIYFNLKVKVYLWFLETFDCVSSLMYNIKLTCENFISKSHYFAIYVHTGKIKP